jgi:hypothetical protein
MNDPPLQLETGRSVYIKRNVADFANRGVEADEVGKRFLIVRSVVAVLEHDSGSGGVVCDDVRADKREVVLSPQ